MIWRNFSPAKEHDYSLDPDQPIYRVRIWERAQPLLVVANAPEEQRGWVPITGLSSQ